MASFSDDFNRANGALGANYDTFTGLATLNVNTNAAAAGSVGQNANTVAPSVATFAADHECEATATAFGAFDFLGLIVRGAPASANGYLFITDGRDQITSRLERIDAGTRTSIGTVNVPVTVGDNVRLRAEGTTISVYVNDVLADSVTDATYASGQPGLYARWENSNTTRFDDFSATDLGPAGPTITDQPDDVTVLLSDGDTASFTVAATGTGTLAYQWEVDDGGGYDPVVGATAATLNLTGLSVVGQFLYRCVVTDDNGSTTSTAATLTVAEGDVVTPTSDTTDGSGVATTAFTSDVTAAAGVFVPVRATAGGITKTVALRPGA